jgi:hypothetical protein
MISFNTQTLSQPSFTRVINNHITVQAAAEATAITSSTCGDYCVLESWKASKSVKYV